MIEQTIHNARDTKRKHMSLQVGTTCTIATVRPERLTLFLQVALLQQIISNCQLSWNDTDGDNWLNMYHPKQKGDPKG